MNDLIWPGLDFITNLAVRKYSKQIIDPLVGVLFDQVDHSLQASQSH